MRRRALLSDSRTKGTLAIPLLLALLFCHGFFGALHQLPNPADDPGAREVTSERAGGHPASHASGGSGDSAAAHLGHGEYYAVVLTLSSLVGALVWLLGNAAGTRRVRFASQPLQRGSSPLAFLRQRRQPTVPFLQVFRL